MPVRYSKDSTGPETRRRSYEPAEHGPSYYKDIETTGAAAEFAAEHGIDLSTVTGTGKFGKITKADVQAALDA